MTPNDPFASNPEFSLGFKHCGLSLTLTAIVESQDALMIPLPEVDNDALLARIYLDALRSVAQEAASQLMKSHSEFAQALDRAVVREHLAYLSASDVENGEPLCDQPEGKAA